MSIICNSSYDTALTSAQGITKPKLLTDISDSTEILELRATLEHLATGDLNSRGLSPANQTQRNVKRRTNPRGQGDLGGYYWCGDHRGGFPSCESAGFGFRALQEAL